MLYCLPHDIKGPRFRKPARNLLNQEFYLSLRKEHPDLTVSVQDIRKIIYTFHELCIDTLSTTRDGLELPLGLGYLIIASSKTNLKHFHPEATNFQNWETNQKMCKIYYTNVPSKYKFKYHNLWAFKPSRQMKKKVSESFKENHTRFVVMSSKLKISHLFKKKDRLTTKLHNINKRLDNESTNLR